MEVGAVTRQLGYLISYKSILDNLGNEVKNLQVERQKVRQNLTWDSEEFQTQSSWLKRVDEIVGQVNAFLNDCEGKGTCTNLLWSLQVGRKARKMRRRVSQIQAEGKFDQSVKPGTDKRAPKSRADTLNDIMEALKEPRIQTVGVWCLGGGGTTSLAKQVGGQAIDQDLFDAVVITTITEKPNAENVQADIAAGLGLQFPEENLVERRNRLHLRIKEEKRILVIVDDIWGELNPQEFDLEEFGVPSGDEHEGCKLLLTSGNFDFLKNVRGASKMFQLEVLEEDEALSLFEKMVGGFAQDSEVSPIATEIVRSCEGSPPSIVAVAKALRNKAPSFWQDALMQLKEVSPIELCFNSLGSDELKSMFLLLSIREKRFINKYSIYIDMWAGLFKNLDTAEAARNRRDTLISDLKAYGLVVEYGKDWVKIDDLLWEAAYSMAQRDLKALMISKEWPPEDWLRSLRFCNVNIVGGLQVPERLECPELQEIVLSTSSHGMRVPDSIFNETKHLKVLDFVGFDCPKLPVSFGLLKNLQALSMYNCKLGDISIVGELTNLQMLGLLVSSIQQLPRQVGQLQKLLFLDLRDTFLQVIPPNVLSNLTSLEELYLRNSFCNWEVERSNRLNSNASLNELRNLHHLAYVEDLYVPDPRAWPVDLLFEKLKSYTVFIGDKWGRTHDGDHGLKTLKVKLNRRFQPDDGIKKMLKNVDVLYLDELSGVQNVLSDLDSDGFPHLQSLVIQDNAEIKCIAMTSSHRLDAFHNLESLSLYNLSNLEHICHGPVTEKSFSRIKFIKVQKCDGMICLFSNSMIKGLPHLADIEVSDCKLIEAIVVVEDAENPHIEFPELCSLKLQGLPALISFCLSKEKSSSAATLFHDKVSFPNLETMMISKVSKLRTIWDQKRVDPNSFWKLKNVNITGCEKLRTVFPVSLSRNLHNLKTLEVINCSSMRSIFTVMRRDDRQPRQGMSIQLIAINLVQLPKLEYVCVNTGFESLKEKLDRDY